MKNYQFIFNQGLATTSSSSSILKIQLANQQCINLLAMYKHEAKLLFKKSKKVEFLINDKNIAKDQTNKLIEGMEIEMRRKNYESKKTNLKNEAESNQLNQTPIKQQIITKVVFNNKSNLEYTNSNNTKVAFYCPSEMKEKTTYEVSVIRGFLLDDNEIKTELLNAINHSRIERAEAPLTINDIGSNEVLIDQYVKIQLLDPANKFKINAHQDYPNQDSFVKVYNENNILNQSHIWKWLVTPNDKTSGTATLIISVIPYNKEMQAQVENEKKITIEVRLQKTFFEKMIDQSNTFLELINGNMVAPLISILAGTNTTKRKKDLPELLYQNNFKTYQGK
jgi:hypothetical protein